MAKVVGLLREDATHGVRAALKLLSRNLPEDLTVYIHSLFHASERRILYMAMSRVCEKLYMTCFGKLPRPYEDLRKQNLADLVG